MATFGDLIVRLGLDKTGFQSGITSSRGSLTQLKSLAVPAAAAVAAVGGAFTATAFAIKDFIAPSFEALDKLGDLSSRLGVATDKLAALQYASGLAGIEQESLTASIGKYLDTLSNAVNGTKSAVAAFDALGLKARDLNQLALDQQFVAVANAIQGIQNPADRVRMAMDLFGKSGGAMLQLLNDGGQNLIATMEEAHALGIAPSAAEVAKIQAANDSIDKMNAALRGLANTMAVEVAPAVESVASALSDPGTVGGFQSLLQGFRELEGVNLAALLTLKHVLTDSAPVTLEGIGKRFDNIHGKIRATSNIAPMATGGLPEIAPDAPLFESMKSSPLAAMAAKSLLSGEKGLALDSRFGAGVKTFERAGELRPSVAPGGMKGAQDTLSRILRAGSHTKDPNSQSIKATENTASIAKGIQKLVDNNGGLVVGLAKAGT